jgi:hypothetical protein
MAGAKVSGSRRESCAAVATALALLKAAEAFRVADSPRGAAKANSVVVAVARA